MIIARVAVVKNIRNAAINNRYTTLPLIPTLRVVTHTKTDNFTT